jgi:tetratricopeptide (TPR) repeat protein
MMQGEFGRSLAAVRTMLAAIPADWLRVPENAAFADGLFAAPVKVLMRFGRWDELLAEPEPAATFPVARALWWSARGVAYTAQGRLDDARAAQQAFRAAVQSVPDKAFFGNNAAADVLAVADGMLAGELLLREGKTQEGLDALRAAVVREDALRYDEPPDWIQPVRHALGAALLKAGRPVEAEQVYREDLQRWPHNGWSLFGLAESLAAQGQDAAAAEARAAFQRAWSRADVTLHSSCFCQ